MNLVEERDVVIEKESIGDLLKDLRDEAMVLVRQQIQLAKTETNEKVSRIAANAGYLLAGGFVLFAGFLFLLTALTVLGYQGLIALGLSAAVSLWLMPLITAVIVGTTGAILSVKAINTFQHTSVVPNKTVHSLKEDQQWLMKKRQ
jgi:hypothetical protein